MYCSSCGSAASQGLSYCNHCGAKLGAAGRGGVEPAGPKPEFLVGAMMTLFIFGMIAIAGLMTVLRGLPGFGFGQIMAVLMLSFLMLFSVEVVFAWLLFRRRRDAHDALVAPSKEHTTNELDAAQLRALPHHMPSVTENATRKFEPAYAERKSE